MLRNLNALTPSGQRVLGTPFVGLLGSAIIAASSTGVHGAGPLVNDGLQPNVRYRLILQSSTFLPGALEINELGQLAATSSGTAIYRLFANNALVIAPDADRTITVFIGVQATAPTVTQQPSNQTATAGQSVTFTVAATGTAPLSYQWQRNGVNISGATGASYTFTAALIDNGALYTCVVTNNQGGAISSPATLTVNPVVVAPSFVLQPQSRTVSEGQLVTFQGSAQGTAPIAYQWLRNSQPNQSQAFQPLAGQTSTNLTFTATLADNGSLFALQASNSAGSVQSAVVSLTVTATPVAPLPPQLPEVTFDDMVPEIAMDVPDCPHIVIALALRDAAKDLYERTRAWRANIPLLTVTVGRQDLYVVSGLPVGAMLLGLPGLWVGDDRVDELQARDELQLPPGSTAFRFRASVVGDDMIRLEPAPIAGGLEIKGEVALMPSASATGIPAMLWRRHADGIKARARQILMEQQGKPWTNPNHAQKHGQDFRMYALRYSTDSGPVSRNPRLRVRPA